MFGGVLTARYPDKSFQRVLSDAKRKLRRVSTYVLRERAGLYADMRRENGVSAA